MKHFKSIAATLLVFSFFGCTTVKTMTMDESVCVKRPAQFIDSASHICDVSWQLQIPPEDTDNLLLDASAMAYVVNAVDKNKIAQFLNATERYLGAACGDMTYDSLFDKIGADAAKSALLMRVLNRRLRFYKSPEPISDFDCWMMHKAIDHQREQFGLDATSFE